MIEDTILVEDAYDAMRLGASLEEGDPRAAQLSSYIDTMARAGFGVPDRVTVTPLEASSDDEPKHRLVVRWSTPSDVWRAARRNINKNGLFIQMEPHAQMGDLMEVQIQMESPAITFECLSKVIWASPQERSGRPMGIGVKFLWDQEKSALFKRFVKGEIDPMDLRSLSPQPDTDGDDEISVQEQASPAHESEEGLAVASVAMAQGADGIPEAALTEPVGDGTGAGPPPAG